MEKKPALYVVERKELIILVIIFVIVTCLSFVFGVQYGKKVGNKEAVDAHMAKQAHENPADSAGTGALHESYTGSDSSGTHNANNSQSHGEYEKSEKSDTDKAHHDNQEETSPETLAAGGGHSDKASQSDQATTADAKRESDKNEPEMNMMVEDKRPVNELDAKNSDAILLEALKKAKLEPKGEGSAGSRPTKLPENSKQVTAGKKPKPIKKQNAKTGEYVIQVGSFPTLEDAERQRLRLIANRIDSRIMEPVKQDNNTWYRVVVGSYSSSTMAKRDARKFKENGVIRNYFVRKIR